MMRVDGFRAPLRNDCQVGKILHQGFVFFKGQDNGFPMPFGVGNVLRVKRNHSGTPGLLEHLAPPR